MIRSHVGRRQTSQSVYGYSHRLELAMQADRVVVLDGARIVEAGTPRELAGRGSRFAKLFAMAAIAE